MSVPLQGQMGAEPDLRALHTHKILSLEIYRLYYFLRKEIIVAYASKNPDLVISEAQVVTKATVAAADRLGLSARTLAGIVGVSEASVSRMKRAETL